MLHLISAFIRVHLRFKNSTSGLAKGASKAQRHADHIATDITRQAGIKDTANHHRSHHTHDLRESQIDPDAFAAALCAFSHAIKKWLDREL